MLRFMKENAPDVGTGVFAAESFNFNHSMTDPILNDSDATANTAFIGGHIYGGGLTKYSLAEAKGKEVWMTEHLELSSDWTGALNTAKEINDCMKANMSAYIWWYIVRFYGPIYDDEGPPGTQKGDVSKRGFVMSQFSRFVRPGFFRVTVDDNPQISVYVTAYKGSTKVVIVAINYGYQSRDQAFKIENNGTVNFRPYVTSETKDATQEDDVAISNGMLTITLEPRSVTTLVSE
jgi:glucuronoarabinoxylan endo-1,4-beta-xylanase